MLQNLNEGNNKEYFQRFNEPIEFNQNQNYIEPIYQKNQLVSPKGNNFINNKNNQINKNFYPNPSYQNIQINNYSPPHKNIPTNNNIQFNQLNGMNKTNDNNIQINQINGINNIIGKDIQPNQIKGINNINTQFIQMARMNNINGNNIQFNQINGMNIINGNNKNILPINNTNDFQSKLNETTKPLKLTLLPFNQVLSNQQGNFPLNLQSESLNRTLAHTPEQKKDQKNQEQEDDNNKEKLNSTNKVNKNINKKLNNKKNDKNSKINTLKLNEEILLRNQKQTLNKDLDIKTHYDIEVTKERFLFNYKKVLKIAIPLLSHYEMPSDYEYKSPLLSPDGQYLSCIAKAETDIVFVWDLDDLYWYKYKFFIPKIKVDCVVFTPDSKSILVIYRKTNPALYNLANGNKILELEKIGDENKKEGFHCAFTIKAAHFGYTTEQSFILWSMNSGKLKLQLKDESPVKLLFNEYIISINNDLICNIKYLKTLKLYLSFKIKGIQNPNEILDSRMSPDMSSFIYVIKQGIIKYIFKEKKYKGLQKFQPGVEKATISDDCRFVVKTNMRNLTIYDIEKGDTIGTILKEKFNEFRIDFNNEKLIVIDNICINIHDYTDGGIPEQFVWLNKNPFRFLDVKFSHDFKFLFALIDQNYVIVYDLNTGLIVKKWQNVDKNWTNFSISEDSGNKIASNSNLFLVKVWNYMTGREDATFYGFDSHSFHFSSNGKYLACGAKNGPEVARIWDIEKGTFGSFPYVGNNSNFHTIVHLTSPEPTRLICCSIDQQPLIFDTNSKELLYKCECLYRFEEIYEIKSDQTYDVFIVKGRDVKKRDIGLLYRISDGILLETYENYTILELAKDQGVIISKCENVNGGKLTSTDLKNLSDPILNDFQIQTDKIELLNDNKCVVVVINEEEYKKEYCLINAEDGGYFGKINFTKKTERNSENYITIDPVEGFIYFRYFEFLSPQESREFRNKFNF